MALFTTIASFYFPVYVVDVKLPLEDHGVKTYGGMEL
jgi:hypothetical protein